MALNATVRVRVRIRVRIGVRFGVVWKGSERRALRLRGREMAMFQPVYDLFLRPGVQCVFGLFGAKIDEIAKGWGRFAFPYSGIERFSDNSQALVTEVE
jgi:hypothetical protein